MLTKLPYDQQIFFKDGSVRWVRGIHYMERAGWVHMLTNDGKEYVVNPKNVNFIIIHNPGETYYKNESKKSSKSIK